MIIMMITCNIVDVDLSHQLYINIDILPGGAGGLKGSARVMVVCGCTGADRLNTSDADRCLSRLLDLLLVPTLVLEGVVVEALVVLLDTPTL